MIAKMFDSVDESGIGDEDNVDGKNLEYLSDVFCLKPKNLTIDEAVYYCSSASQRFRHSEGFSFDAREQSDDAYVVLAVRKD